jgi:hypothetical protein
MVEREDAASGNESRHQRAEAARGKIFDRAFEVRANTDLARNHYPESVEAPSGDEVQPVIGAPANRET